MKILLINDHAHFSGGGDAVLFLEKESMIQRGHEVLTYTWGDSAKNKDASIIVAPEPRKRGAQRFAKFFGNRKMRLHFREALKKINPDIIHVHLVSKYPLAIYPEIRDYPVFQTMHGPTFFCPSGWGNYRSNCEKCQGYASFKCYTAGCCSFIQAFLARRLYNYMYKYFKDTVNQFHTPSRHLAESIRNWGFSNVKYIPLGIDHIFSERPINPWPRQRNILFIGALIESKGIDVLIDAFPEVIRRFPDVKLQIAGRGIWESLIRKKIEEYHIENNVDLLGFVDREKALSLYQNAFMFVIPSTWFENAPVVVTEGLASGTPGVGSRVGGINELLGEHPFGLVVPPRNPQALAEKMIYLLDNPDKAQEMGLNGREYVLKKYDPDQYISELEKEFNALINENNKR